MDQLMSKGHYLKATNRTTAPARLLSFSVAHREGVWDDGSTLHPRVFESIYSHYQLRYGNRWGRVESRHFKTPREWWDYIYYLTRDGSPLFIIGHSCFDDLCLAGLFDEFDKKHLRLYDDIELSEKEEKPLSGDWKGYRGCLIAKNPPDIIRAKTRKGTIRAVSLRNYTPAPVAELAKVCGIEVRKPKSTEPRSSVRGVHPEALASIVHLSTRHLINWWRMNNCGPWRDTAAQLSLSVFKQHYCKHKLLIHHDDEASELERRACYGGCARTWYYGDCGEHPGRKKGIQKPPPPSQYGSIPGPFYRLDVRSMYPHLFSVHSFPVKYIGTWHRPYPSQVFAASQYFGLIAEVKINSHTGEYPKREGKRLRWPVGTFRTTLAGPELLQAMQEGAILEYGDVSRYELAPAFQEFANWLWDSRVNARQNGNLAEELWYKTIAVAFAGKLAQRGGRWVGTDHRPNWKRWGKSWVKTHGKDGFQQYRHIAGQCEIWDDTARKRATSAATFAYLTAYGRMKMRKLRELIGPANCVSQDTDCLWVTEAGYHKLREEGHVDDTRFGGLKLENIIQYARFLTPKHYYQDDSWVLSGISEGFAALSNLIFKERTTVNPHRTFAPDARATVWNKYCKKHLSAVLPPGGVDSDGWALPDVCKPDWPLQSNHEKLNQANES